MQWCRVKLKFFLSVWCSCLKILIVASNLLLSNNVFQLENIQINNKCNDTLRYSVKSLFFLSVWCNCLNICNLNLNQFRHVRIGRDIDGCRASWINCSGSRSRSSYFSNTLHPPAASHLCSCLDLGALQRRCPGAAAVTVTVTVEAIPW